ncbi:filament-like plant protein 3 isoform X2 [Canna indica]|uniref:Filament-like plant protein 3 isoform X2 n=1 Tax=Canna indica TaxID=4628 RepID=A0AAQ3K7H9_9LILI|nr:filament-like plant protein 3 isoform X2 [Canna indica]
MDRRSWLWKRKSSEKNAGETESSGSVSSERHSGEQEVLKTSSINSSPNHAQLPEVSSKDVNHEVNEIIKTLNNKLSAALLNISAKEDLVKQHAKVAEEAVLGWENADKEVSSLKQQLEAASKKNSSLEDKAIHLDAALKECVRQLRLSREEQEQKVLDAIRKKTHEWESEKSELEIRLVELQAQLEAKAEFIASFDRDFISEIEALKEENSGLKFMLFTLTNDLQTRALELELSTRSAETASKQHLDSIKKVARLDAECRKLRAAARKSSLANEHKLISNSHYADSVTDSQSDAGEKLLSLDNEQSCSDSWASALIVELDQLKEKDNTRNNTTSVEIGLMDDFLEMERLVALPEADHGSSSIEHDADSDHTVSRDGSSRKELETVRLRMTELEELIEKMKYEKVEMDRSLAIKSNQLKSTDDQLVVAESKLAELQRQLNLVNGEKHALEIELESTEAKKNELDFQLESTLKENSKLHERVTLFDRKFEEEMNLSAKLKVRCQHMESIETKMNQMELQLELAYGEIAELKGNVSLLEGNIEEEKKLSTELASRCWKVDELKVKKEELESQLESANMELSRLHEKVDLVERKFVEEKAFSSELLAKCETMEVIKAKKTELDCQFSTKQLEVSRLQEKVNMLEGNVEKERALLSVLVADKKAIEAKRDELVVQLELDHLEIRRLQEKVSTLEKQVEEEKALSMEFEAKYHKLEVELFSKQEAPQFHLSASSNKKLMLRQEEVALAAGKLVECQKTIASLNQQLKSLANFDDFMLLTHRPDSNGGPLEFSGESMVLDPFISPENLEVSSALPNVKQSDSQMLSTFSAGHLEFSLPSRKNRVIETQ